MKTLIPQNIFLLLMSFPILLGGCTGDLVFSELTNTRTKLRFKGTYESNDAQEWGKIHTSKNIANLKGADYKNDFASISADQLKFFIDIAEVRISNKTGLESDTKSKDHWYFFSKNRILFCSDYNALNNKTLKNCSKQKGIDNLNKILGVGYSGDHGININVVDVRPNKTYHHIGIYFRKFITSPTFRYDKNGDRFGKDLKSSFESRRIKGIDVEPFYQSRPDGSTNHGNLLMFPLDNYATKDPSVDSSNFNLNMKIEDDNQPLIIELRVMIKNLMMLHDLNLDSSGDKLTRFIGFSDWNFPHDHDGSITEYDENSRNPEEGNLGDGFSSKKSLPGRMGGNVAMIARLYKPSTVGSITFVNVTGGALGKYLAVIPGKNASCPTKKLPYAATKWSNIGEEKIMNLPPGDYTVCKMSDNNNDGWPETGEHCTNSVLVQKSKNTKVSLNEICE